MKLSKRLEAIASLIEINKRVIDVGCDHAYLDIYLTLNNKNRCLATDINGNALNNAKLNIKKYNLEDKIETRLTNGLDNIQINKTDNIVISGMGAYNIINILKGNCLSDTLILSANNNIEILREKIVQIGYYIADELFIIDNNKPYIIIKFKKGNKKYKKIDYIVGPILKNNIEFKRYFYKKYTEIYKSIPKTKLFIKLKYKKLIRKYK